MLIRTVMPVDVPVFPHVTDVPIGADTQALDAVAADVLRLTHKHPTWSWMSRFYPTP